MQPRHQLLVRLPAHLVRQSGLPYSGLARHRKHAAGADGDGIQDFGDLRELLAAAEEGCRVGAPGGTPAATDQPPGRNRFTLALQRQLADRLELEHVARELAGQLADVGLAGRGGGLETLRQDDRVSEHGVVHPCLASENPCDAVSRVDADMQRELRLVRQVGAHARELAVHLEGDGQGACCVVLVSHGSAEKREQSVARELLDVALIASDDAAQAADHGVDHLEELLRIQPVGQRRKARDVREERRDQPPLLGDLSPCLHESLRNGPCDEAAQRVGDLVGHRRRRFSRGSSGHRRSAVTAEAHASDVLAAAGGAGPRGRSRGGAAVAAEAHAFGVLDATGSARPRRHRLRV